MRREMSEQPQATTWTWPDLDELPPSVEADFVPVALHRVVGTAADVQRVADGVASNPEVTVQAGELVAQAHDEADDIRQRVREEEVARAREAVDTALRETVAEQVTAFEQAREVLLTEVRESFAARLEEIESRSVMLVTAMTEKVIGRKLDLDDTIVLDVVRASLSEAADASNLTVRVSPTDEPLVAEAQAELLAALGAVDHFQIVADQSVSRGGCIVETERGRFDARIETQLELLSEQVERLLKAG
jgi:flagellar assembly protein FliH